LGELTASLAHEVRNPLGSIRGVAEILRDESQTLGNKNFIEILLEETQRLDAVVAHYLSYAKSPKPAKEKINLQKIIDSMTAILGPEARKKNIVFHVTSESRDVFIYGQEGLIRQAFLNILINAIQASPENSTIVLSLFSNDKSVGISCTDQGPGIPEEEQKQIFAPFYTTKDEGTGLGLAITKRIIREHDGILSVKSKSGYGTTVTMEFQNVNKK
jgi:signal transduction histidine kinase